MLVKYRPFALFSIYNLTTSSEKNLEDFSHVQIFSLMYKLISSGKGSDALFIYFDQDRVRSQRVLTIKKGTFHVRILLENVLGFEEHQKRPFSGSARNYH